MRTLILADDGSWLDGSPTPKGLPDTPTTLGQLLDRAAPKWDGGRGTLILAGCWDRYILDARLRGANEYDGWTCTDPREVWTRYERADAKVAVWVALHTELDLSTHPLTDMWPEETGILLDRWHTHTGTAWCGTPGMAGTALLRDIGERYETEPHWRFPRPSPDITEPEAAWTDVTVTAADDVHDYRYRVTYDTNKAYLAAAISGEYAAGKLAYRAHQLDGFDRRRSGYWRATVSPWTRTDLPCPWTSVAPSGGTGWFTTPTLALLDDLTRHADHPYGGFTVDASWTAPGRRVLRPWGETLRDALAVPELHTAAKRTFRQTWGMLRREDVGRIRRPDWHWTLMATARANLFRRLDAASSVKGVVLVHIATDAATYATDDPDGPVELAEELRLTDDANKLGAMKWARTLDTFTGEVASRD